MLNRCCILLIRLIRPLLGPANCNYTPSCGIFAIQQLKEKNFFTASWLIIKRVLRCNPFFLSSRP